VEVIGRKPTAYIGGVRGVCAMDRWMAGGELYGDAGARLRFAYSVVRTLREYDSPGVVQAWLTGMNPVLGDRVPLRFFERERPRLCGSRHFGRRTRIPGRRSSSVNLEVRRPVVRMGCRPDACLPTFGLWSITTARLPTDSTIQMPELSSGIGFPPPLTLEDYRREW
jgi:hypothetical protein